MSVMLTTPRMNTNSDCLQIGGLVGFWINYGLSETMVRMILHVFSLLLILFQGAQSQAVDHPLCSTAYTRRSSPHRCFLHQRISQVAFLKEQTRRSTQESLLDPPAGHK